MPILSEAQQSLSPATIERLLDELLLKTQQNKKTESSNTSSSSSKSTSLSKTQFNDLEVFHLKLTNEVFRDYEEYVERLILYKMPIWQCLHTGRKNLTFQQASHSEKTFLDDQLFHQYPKHIMKHICTMVHKSVLPLKDLVDCISIFFENNLVVGEEVLCELDNGRLVHVRIVRIVKRPLREQLISSSSSCSPTAQSPQMYSHERDRQSSYLDVNNTSHQQPQFPSPSPATLTSPSSTPTDPSLLQSNQKQSHYHHEAHYIDQSLILPPIKALTFDNDQTIDSAFQSSSSITPGYHQQTYHHDPNQRKLYKHDPFDIKTSDSAFTTSNVSIPPISTLTSSSDLCNGNDYSKIHFEQYPNRKNETLHPSNDSEILYEVELLEGPQKGDILIARKHLLIRTTEPISKVALYQWIKENTTREYEGGPLLLRYQLVEYFELEEDTPSNKYSESSNFESKKLEYLSKLSKESLAAVTKNESTRKKSTKTKTKSSPAEIPLSQYLEQKRMESSLADPGYPDSHESQNKDTPAASKDFGGVSQKCVCLGIAVWNFLYTFQTPLKLSPFPLELFLNAIHHKEQSKLLMRVVKALLLALLNDKDSNLPADTNLPAVCKAIKRQYLEITNNQNSKLRYRKNMNSIPIILQSHCMMALRTYLIEHEYFEETIKEENSEENELEKTTGASKGAEIEKTDAPSSLPPNENNEEKTGIIHYKSENSILYRWDHSEEGYFSLNDEEKVYILHFLVDRCTCLSLIRNHIDYVHSNKRVIAKKKYQEHMEALQSHRELLESIKKEREILKQEVRTKKEKYNELPDIPMSRREAETINRKEERIKILNETERKSVESMKQNKEQRDKKYEEQNSKFYVRTVPLGMDRHGNRYWFFPGFTGMLLVEAPFIEQPKNKSTNSNAAQNDDEEDEWQTTVWSHYSNEEELKLLKNYLNKKYTREKKLLEKIIKFETQIIHQMKVRNGTEQAISTDHYIYDENGEDVGIKEDENEEDRKEMESPEESEQPEINDKQDQYHDDDGDQEFVPKDENKEDDGDNDDDNDDEDGPRRSRRLKAKDGKKKSAESEFEFEPLKPVKEPQKTKRKPKKETKKIEKKRSRRQTKKSMKAEEADEDNALQDEGDFLDQSEQQENTKRRKTTKR